MLVLTADRGSSLFYLCLRIPGSLAQKNQGDNLVKPLFWKPPHPGLYVMHEVVLYHTYGISSKLQGVVEKMKG